MKTGKNILRGKDFLLPLPNDLSLGQLLLDRIASHEDCIAMINGDTNERVTFTDLLNQSSRLAVYLKNQGLKQCEKIAVCSENSLNFEVPVLAALYLGVATCPLNPGYLEQEFIHALNISKPSYIFVSEIVIETMNEIVRKLDWSPKLVSMGKKSLRNVPCMTDWIKNTPLPQQFRASEISGEDHLICILCSSGTTGLPKGVMLTNKNFINSICVAMDLAHEYVAGDTVISALLPFFHAYAFVSLILQNFIGATAVTIPRFDPEQFLAIIEKYKIRNLILVPPLMVFLAKSPLIERYDLSSVRQIWCGAAALSPKIQQAVYERLNRPVIRQGYGLTETTLSVLKTSDDSGKIGSVGTLAAETLGKVIPIDGDGNEEPLGPRQEGELCFKGGQIMKGYCGDKQSTAATIDKDGWLHTGDIGYYDEDGYFYIVDRLKELIKYNGFQVPPAELEVILLSHPEIQDAAVIGLPDEESGELPLAFIVKRPGSNVTAAQIVEFVNGRVSAQKRLRGGVRFLDVIPKTASGKILRRLLRDALKSKL